MSDCQGIREQLLDSIRGRLDERNQERVLRHLETCAECRHVFERERALELTLAQRPTFALPSSLRERLEAQVKPVKPERPKPVPISRARRWVAVLGPSLAAAALLVFAVRAWVVPNPLLVGEAVNDHLRVIYAEHPIEIESGGIHQVKPWFTGRLDFAPAVTFSGDDEFPMLGGAIGLFVDRKAATFIFKHRLHTASLFVFRGEGLSWPLRNDTQVGGHPAASSTSRGFNVLLWRDGDLGYALVSDMDLTALSRLGAKVAAH